MQTLSSPVKLIEDSFRIFFKTGNLIYFLAVYLPLVPFRIFSYFQSYLVDTNGVAKYSWSINLVLAMNLLLLVVSLLALIMAIEGMRRIYSQSELSYKEIINFAWSNMWRFFLVILVMYLAIFGGMILLIIPGILIGVWFSQATFVCIDGGWGVKDSLSKSKELVKGKFWAVLGRIIVFGLFAFVAGLILSFIPFGIGNIFTTLLGGLFVLPSFLLYKELSRSNY